MERQYQYGETDIQRRHYDSLKNYIGWNKIYPCGDILCVSTKNNDVYDLCLLADGISDFRNLYAKMIVANGYQIVDVQEDEGELRIKIER